MKAVSSRSPVFVLTRAAEDNATLAGDLRAAGAVVIELPCVRIDHLDDARALAEEVRALEPEDWLAFTSRAGVEAVRRVVLVRDVRARVAAVGPATAARCVAWGIAAPWTPSEANGAALGRELPLGAGTVLLARAEHADEGVVRHLTARGARVRDVLAYRVSAEVTGDVQRAREALLNGAFAVLASPSAAASLAAAVGRSAFDDAQLFAIGATTARRVESLTGKAPRIVSALTAHALLDAEVRHVAGR